MSVSKVHIARSRARKMQLKEARVLNVFNFTIFILFIYLSAALMHIHVES